MVWQYVIIALVLAGCLVYAARHVWMNFRNRSNNPQCAGCALCDSCHRSHCQECPEQSDRS